MTLLKRHLAPIDERVWRFIEDEARNILKQRLNGRKVVDIYGPKGLDYAAYNTGRCRAIAINEEGASCYLREVLPLVDVEVPFSLKKKEIEALLRGAEDVDIDSLIVAARKLAAIENKAIYFGWEEAGIKGLARISEQKRLNISEETGFLSPISQAILDFKRDGVEGPYNLVLGPYLYTLLYKMDEKGYPLKKKLEDLIEGDLILAEELGEQGLLSGTRNNDFQLIIGQDVTIGFKEEREEEIEFFLTESFTFKVNAPEAVVVIEK